LRAVSGVVLSAFSFALFVYTAGAEPYIYFRWSDLALNCGLGAILFVLFVAWAVACVRSFQRSASRGSLAKALLCASLLWTAINLFYLGNVISGYPQDMNNPRLRALR
jgi:hypothetical protein